MSDYFTSLLSANGINVPLNYTMDYRTASQGYKAVQDAVGGGAAVDALSAGCKLKDAAVSCSQLDAHAAWASAPQIGGIPIIADLPALGIVFVITALVYIGIRESKTASNIMVAVKLAIILLVIVLGAFYVKTENWNPFLPNGFGGVMTGVAAVFFAYVGFDALSTTAEECKDPYKTLPRGMIFSLIICTVLMWLWHSFSPAWSPTKLAVGDPLAFVFGPEGVDIPWVAGIIAVSAVVALATVLLVFQLGQPRLWMAMSRDGLLPKVFSSIHPKFRTPWFSTLLTGVLVAVPALFMNLTEVTDLSVIGTLFAFTIVCAGVLVKDKEFAGQKRFVPYINSRYIVPVLFLLVAGALFYFNGEAVRTFFTDYTSSEEAGFIHKIPYFVFTAFAVVMATLCIIKRLSLIPVLGVMFCTFLMTELGITNWIRFGIWMLVGVLVYFLYSYKHSKLHIRGDSA